ncbi:MAG: hypothetical protein ACR2P4_10010 [Gammaproteobacteria bacterium]
MEKPKGVDKAIQEVLLTAQEPMRAADISGEIARRGWWKDEAKTNPIDAVRIWLSDGVNADPQRYERVDHGLYRLHPNYDPETDDVAQRENPKPLNESRLIQSFGMFWDRTAWEAKKSPQLWGKQLGGEEVDFGDKQGIYILYYFSKVVYVGRATKQGIGIRLQEHTQYRLKNRWNRFSWFAFGEWKSGQLTQDTAIADLEALLIEFADPPQNRRRGDKMEAIEYSQV